MTKVLRIKEAVRIDPKEFPFLGLDANLANTEFRVVEFGQSAHWGTFATVEDADGNAYDLAVNAIVPA